MLLPSGILSTGDSAIIVFELFLFVSNTVSVALLSSINK